MLDIRWQPDLNSVRSHSESIHNVMGSKWVKDYN